MQQVGIMSRWGRAFRLIGIGWYIALCIVLGATAGLWLDRKWDTGVWLTFIGLTIGLVVALFGSYRMIRQTMKEELKEDEDKG